MMEDKIAKLNRYLENGLRAFGDAVNATSDVIRAGDSSIRTIDEALRGHVIPPSPDQAFQNVMAHMISMREMARGGSASTPAIAQKAREILGMVHQVEPDWKPRPSNIRTRGDMMRLAMRDLRASQALMKLASGQGTTEDISALINWMGEVSGRVQKYPQKAPGAEPAPAPAMVKAQEAGVPGMGSLPVKNKGVSTEDTIAHQHREMTKHMLLLEGHLQQGCKINRVACDCCSKHPIIIQGLAEEAIGMVNNPIYSKIMEWCQKVIPITTEESSASGNYDQQYPNLASELRYLRKSLPS